MRAGDRPVPAFTPHPPSTVPWPAKWHLVLEGVADAPYRWDDGTTVWDGAAVWDSPYVSADYTDLSCDVAGIEVEHGPMNDDGQWPASSMTATLVDADGSLTQWDRTGQLVNAQIGRRIMVLADWAGDWWWIFAGAITGWDDLTVAGQVTVEAFSTVELLARPVVANDATWSPGSAGELPDARVAAILAATQPTTLYRIERPGSVTLTKQPTSETPWDELAVVAGSDAGVVFVDADDVVVYQGRNWGSGRPGGPTPPRTLTTFACDEPGATVGWDVVLRVDNDRVANAVELVNVAGVKVSAVNTPSPWQERLTLTHPFADQWTTTAEGNGVARTLANRWQVARVAVDRADLWLHDARYDLWPWLDTRPGDRMRLVHTFDTPTGPGRFDVDVIAAHIVHSITPEQWIVTLGSSEAVAWRPAPTDPDVVYPYAWDDKVTLWDTGAYWDAAPLPIPYP